MNNDQTGETTPIHRCPQESNSNGGESNIRLRSTVALTISRLPILSGQTGVQESALAPKRLLDGHRTNRRHQIKETTKCSAQTKSARRSPRQIVEALTERQSPALATAVEQRSERSGPQHVVLYKNENGPKGRQGCVFGAETVVDDRRRGGARTRILGRESLGERVLERRKVRLERAEGVRSAWLAGRCSAARQAARRW